MESKPTQNNRPVNPRRKHKTKAEIFREVYLPFLIVAASVLAIIGLIAAIAAGLSREDTTSAPALEQQREAQAAQLLAQAAVLADSYDYEAALALLQNCDSELAQLSSIRDAISSYTIIQNTLVTWTAQQVPNLSVHVLVADLEAALADPTYGNDGNGRYNQNFITTTEFSNILQQLYDGGYVLVRLSDLYEYNADTQRYSEKPLLLPVDKKPLLLTETHCTYYTYMAPSNAFATRLRYENGTFVNDMVNSAGETVTGNFDLVPILEQFIAAHPDFSYKGARAILACSGYDGFFGYRIAGDTLSGQALAGEQERAAALAQALRDRGYMLACYTYANTDYSVKSAQDISRDIQLWQEQIGAVIGQTDIMVFAQEGDIGTSYEQNEKFQVLYAAGYRYYLGSAPFLTCETDLYVRHSRLMVTGAYLKYHSNWFKDILDTASLLDSGRGTIPNG